MQRVRLSCRQEDETGASLRENESVLGTSCTHGSFDWKRVLSRDVPHVQRRLASHMRTPTFQRMRTCFSLFVSTRST